MILVLRKVLINQLIQKVKNFYKFVIDEIKPEGKNSMDAKSFFNGVGRNLVGEKLG